MNSCGKYSFYPSATLIVRMRYFPWVFTSQGDFVPLTQIQNTTCNQQWNCDPVREGHKPWTDGPQTPVMVSQDPNVKEFCFETFHHWKSQKICHYVICWLNQWQWIIFHFAKDHVDHFEKNQSDAKTLLIGYEMRCGVGAPIMCKIFWQSYSSFHAFLLLCTTLCLFNTVLC